ncbi:MAG: dienelactone hydrolase family protein [Candidatus Thiodiazotropha lotti]|nr:dienelactone hydrolase family protein [Candidatus Thiodiazotropha lotti]MCG8003259.1 dienelactone hydrolase family protein [Candidatus Thiodiazotropha lotti]MCW4186881.1 dienelactone hydrolase family protein [Candidatus Thiodiazotropha lotti]MCW4200450.1 dienelactone hydrolase family protein [Candidatus Thiodiazotropha lotti]
MRNRKRVSAMGQEIELMTEQGERFQAYLSGSDESIGGILILHEWWGVKPHNRQWADQFANVGYQALVVDLYDGRVTEDAEQAAQWMREIDQQAADRKLIAGIEYLSRRGRKIAVYGCSFGGKQAMQASLLKPELVDATVMAYCRMETDPVKLAQLQGPVLAIYAEQERNWPEKQHNFEQAMSEAGKLTESVSYDAAHGFTNPTSPRYDEVADKAAWQVVIDFLQQEIAG